MNRRKSKHKEKLNIAMFGQKRIPSREGGVEIVVEELCTRMVAQGHNVTCYNRGGHSMCLQQAAQETINSEWMHRAILAQINGHSNQ